MKQNLTRAQLALRVFLVSLGLLVIATFFVGIRGALAVQHLHKASDAVSAIQSDVEESLKEGEIPKESLPLASQASEDTRSARSLTQDVVWRAYGYLPFVGKYFDSTRRAAKAADLVVSSAVQPALNAAALIVPVRQQIHDGTIPLGPFAQAAPLLEQASNAMNLARKTIDPARVTGVGVFDRQLVKLRTAIDRLAPRLDDARRTADLVPTMAGGNGVRRYFIGFLTNSESRTQAGLLGSYAILRADHGKLSFEHFGSDTELQDSDTPVVDFGAEFRANYGGSTVTTSWRDSPEIAYFPEVANVWTNLVKEKTGQQLDGAFMTDPIALSYVLDVLGPAVLPSGEVIDANNVVAKTENEAYQRFAADNGARRDYLKSIFKAVSEEFINTASPDERLFSRVGQAIHEGRLKLWAQRPLEQATITGSPLEGAFPAAGSPLVWFTFNNLLGNKMDYYLQRHVIYTPAACGQGAKIELDLSTIPDVSGLSNYIAGAYTHFRPLPRGTTALHTTLYLDKGQSFFSSTIDGKQAFLRQFTEHGLTGLSTDIVVLPGQTTKFVIQLTPPKHSGVVRVVASPLVLPQQTTFRSPPHC